MNEATEWGYFRQKKFWTDGYIHKQYFYEQFCEP